MSRNKKFPFPTLNDNRLYEYDSTTVANKNEVLKLGKYYNEESICINLTDSAYADKLYKKVLAGSLRWWLLERRKFDHQWFNKIGTINTPSKNACSRHEAEWTKKIDDWYANFNYGLTEAPEKVTVKAPSKYKLNKYFDNDKELSLTDACRIGAENGKPKFYRVIKKNETDIAVECLVDIENIGSINGVTKFSEKWWTIERMRYDFGDKFHPVATEFGMISSDWKGIEYKFINGLHNIANTDIVSYHERGWIQWVNSYYRSSAEKKYKKIDRNNRYTHNVKSLEKLDIADLARVANIYPELILECMPPAYAKATCEYAISFIEDKCYLSNDDKKYLSALKVLVSKIRKPAVEISDCANFDISIVMLACSNLAKYAVGSILLAAAVKVSEYNLLKQAVENEISFEEAVGALVNLRYKVHNYDSCEKYELDGIDWFSQKDNRFANVLKQEEREREIIMKKFDLI